MSDSNMYTIVDELIDDMRTRKRNIDEIIATNDSPQTKKMKEAQENNDNYSPTVTNEIVDEFSSEKVPEKRRNRLYFQKITALTFMRTYINIHLCAQHIVVPEEIIILIHNYTNNLFAWISMATSVLTQNTIWRNRREGSVDWCENEDLSEYLHVAGSQNQIISLDNPPDRENTQPHYFIMDKNIIHFMGKTAEKHIITFQCTKTSISRSSRRAHICLGIGVFKIKEERFVGFECCIKEGADPGHQIGHKLCTRSHMPYTDDFHAHNLCHTQRDTLINGIQLTHGIHLKNPNMDGIDPFKTSAKEYNKKLFSQGIDWKGSFHCVSYDDEYNEELLHINLEKLTAQNIIIKKNDILNLIIDTNLKTMELEIRNIDKKESLILNLNEVLSYSLDTQQFYEDHNICFRISHFKDVIRIINYSKYIQ
eukprot:505847_1